MLASKKSESEQESLVDQVKSIQSDISAQSFEFVAKAVKFILAHSNEIKVELNSLLADLTDKTPEEIGKTNIVTYGLLVKDFFLKPELREALELLLLIQIMAEFINLETRYLEDITMSLFCLSTIKWNDFPEFLSVLFDAEFDDRLWQIYLLNPLRTDSFNDFKQKMLNDVKPKEQVESEAQTAAKKCF